MRELWNTIRKGYAVQTGMTTSWLIGLGRKKLTGHERGKIFGHNFWPFGVFYFLPVRRAKTGNLRKQNGQQRFWYVAIAGTDLHGLLP